jgi:hypothetical protein
MKNERLGQFNGFRGEHQYSAALGEDHYHYLHDDY